MPSGDPTVKDRYICAQKMTTGLRGFKRKVLVLVARAGGLDDEDESVASDEIVVG